MQRKSVRDIKSFGTMTDRRRARTPHGAFLELASLALHRHRLRKEQQTAAARNAAIEIEIRAMDRKAALLQTFIEDPRLLTGGHGVPDRSNRSDGPDRSDPSPAVRREHVLRY